MEFIYILLTLLLTALALTAVFFAKKKDISITLPRRICAIILPIAAFCRYMIGKVAVYGVQGVNMYSPFGDGMAATVFSVLIIWFVYAAIFIIVFDELFDFPELRNMARYFSAPVLLTALVGFSVYGVGVEGADAFSGFNLRLTLMALEIALGIFIVASRIITDGYTKPTRSAVAEMFKVLPFAVIALMPIYTLQALFGYVDPTLGTTDFSPEHRVTLYFSIIIPFVIFHVLKDKDEHVKRTVMLYFCYSLLWSYLANWEFADLRNPLSWPLHLCNTAMFLFPICLTFKLEKVFNFCLFINVMGALLAALMPNIGDANLLSTETVLFWLNHYPAFFMPLLLVALKLFKRPKFKEWVYSLIVFTIYFVLILFINAWFTNYGDVDYFFLNSDFVVSKLGKWAEDTRNIVASFKIKELTFTFYPLYQALFYLVYVAVTVGIWFLYEILFASWDLAEDRRLRERDYKRMKKELFKFLNGKSIHETISGDYSPRLILKNFSKKYGTNKHYSVNNVSFEVHGGEIFGFLGPNGAGKSTIIKSIVGIQTITSGSIEVCGYDVEKQPVQAKLTTGFVPDHYALYENLTGREYINYIADLYQVNKEYRDMMITKYVDRFQLTGSFDNQMKTYSHGMKQKITIMAALVHNPKVWILDEPLTGLDPTSIHEVKECMKEHAANGNIVFFSSHIIDVVEKICDRIAIIKKGKLRASAKVSDLEAQGIELEQFYLDVINAADDEQTEKIESADDTTAQTVSAQ